MNPRFLGAHRKSLFRRSPSLDIPHIVSKVISAVEKKQRKSRPTAARPAEDFSESREQSDDESLESQDEGSAVPDPPGYPAEPDDTNIIFGYSHTALRMDIVQKWLLMAENGERYGDYLMTIPPKKPKEGQILLYKCHQANDRDHHRDEYSGFQMYATNVSKPKQPVYKKYFRMYDPDGTQVNFEKFTYELKSSKNKDSKVVMIHYMGDSSLFKERCHKNSKSGRIYTASTKKVLSNIEKEIRLTGQNPLPVYDKVVKASLEDDEIRSREAVLVPRDRKQVQNIKYKVDQEKRLMRCEIFSLIEMGRNKDLGGFIIRHVVNPYDLVVMADPAALRFATHLLKAGNLERDLPQYLCYDTTFQLGDAYVSVLVIRNTYFNGDPIFPVAYLIHERKLQAVHTEFFKILNDEIFFDAISENVPIVMDREIGIINAVLAVAPNANILLCTNHIKQDVKRWVREAGGKGDDIVALKGHVKRLLACETEEEYDEYYSTVEPMWSQDFKTYMKEHLHDDMKFRSSRWVVDRFSAFKNKQVTNNASETFNFMIKNENQWKELRVDSLVLSLFNLQLNKMREISRSFQSAGVGEYVLKSAYRNLPCPLTTPYYVAYSMKKFLELFKEGIYRPSQNIEKEGNYMQSRSALAKIACENNLVSLDSKSGVFVVTGVYSAKRVVVQRKDDGTLTCTCNSSGYCYHKLAVLYALNIEISEDTENYSLSILRKKTRNAKKTGRKIPNADDFISNVDPAPDSDLTRKREDFEGNESAESDIQPAVSTNIPSPNVANGLHCSGDPSYSSDSDICDVSVHSGSSNGSNRSFQAIHHYPLEDFVEPNDDLDMPRNSFSGARSVSTDGGLPSALLISSVPDVLPKAWMENSTFQCLGPKQWIMEDIFNDMTRFMIRSLHLEESVAFVNTHEFSLLLSKQKYSDFVSFAVRSQGLNSDILVINMRACSHFFFAVVAYRRKEVIIIDSMTNKLPGTSDVHHPLLLFVAATHYVGLVEFDLDAWKIITETEVQQQPNGYDCGPYAVYNQYRLLQKMCLHVGKDFPSSSTLRRWILYCLHMDEAKVSVLLPRGRKTKRLLPKIKRSCEILLENLSISDEVIKPLPGCRSAAIADELRIGTKNWYPCSANECVAAPDCTDFLLCTYCRGWFHIESCVSREDATADYFLCSLCTQKRISI